MPHDTPIACSLGAGELPDRLAQIRALGRDSLLGADGSVLRFRADPRTRERLEALVAAESACCPFLDFELVARPGALVLAISGPEAAEPVVGELVDAFRGGVG